MEHTPYSPQKDLPVFTESDTFPQFSFEHVEAFRQRINKAAGYELLEGPLDEDEAAGLVELYARTYKRPDFRDVQVERLQNILRGEDLYDLADERDEFGSNIRRMQTNAAKALAAHLEVLFRSSDSLQSFSPEAVEKFRNQLNNVADQELFGASLGEDEVAGLIDIYGRSYTKQAHVSKNIDRLLLLFEGKTKAEIATITNSSESNIRELQSNALKLIAAKLGKLFDEHEQFDTFSAEHVEKFRQNINETAGKEILSFPLDEDEVYGLIDMYARNHPMQNRVGYQATRLTMMLEGKSWSRIADETNSKRSTIRNLQVYAAEIIARSLNDIFVKEPENRIATRIEECVESGVLSPEEAAVFKRHVGVVDEPLTNGQISRNVETCEKLRRAVIDAEIRDRNRRDRRIDNKPAQDQQKIFRRLLGSRPDAISPMSRRELVKQYEELQQRLGYDFVDQQQEPAPRDYSDIVDEAIIGNLEWLLNPKYTLLPPRL